MNSNNSIHILIGNGFNLALSVLSKDIKIKFAYEDILKEVKERVKHKDPLLLSFLDQSSVVDNARVNDVERLIWILSRSSACLKYDDKIYVDVRDNWEKNIERHRSLLKKTVIQVMTDKKFHPNWRMIFNKKNNSFISTCSNNLNSFDRIFTINYDLVLYWLLNKCNLLEKRKLKDGGKISEGHFRDGFIIKENDEDILSFKSTRNRENLLFLHGALHILSKEMDAFKVIKNKKNLTLLDIRKELIRLEKYDNCLILNASSHEKINDIYRNSYLIKAYDKLRTCDGEMIIYGCKDLCQGNASAIDEHLWRNIVNCETLKTIYVGVGVAVADLDSKAQQIANELRKLRVLNNDMSISCFPYKTCNIWKIQNFIAALKSQACGKVII